jgi:transposase
VSESEGPSREDLVALVTRQAQTIAKLEAEVAELRRQLGQHSGNSSMPPSADDLPGRKLPPEKSVPPAKRRRGQQPGAMGMNLPWSDNPDERRDYFPIGTCGCGADLVGACDLGVALSHQEHDIPAMTRVTQHDRHGVRCGCGAEHLAPVPQGVADAPVSYGVNLQALCVLLLVVHAIPVQRCAQLIAAVTGAAPSVGFVHSLLRRTYAALSEVDRRIRTLVSLSYVVTFDETPLRVGPKRVKKQLLVACTRLYTDYLIGDRSLTTFKAFLLPELASGVVVHDRYVNYDSTELAKLRAEADLPELLHQLCAAHILRDLQAMQEAYPDQPWPAQITKARKGLIHAANTARDAGANAIDPKVKAKLLRLFRDGVEQLSIPVD